VGKMESTRLILFSCFFIPTQSVGKKTGYICVSSRTVVADVRRIKKPQGFHSQGAFLNVFPKRIYIILLSIVFQINNFTLASIKLLTN
jgi:hypothetical protein